MSDKSSAPLEAPLKRESRISRNRRSSHSLNEGWRFHKGFIPSSTPHLVNDATWREVDLPHDWSIEGPFDEKNIYAVQPIGKFYVASDKSGLPTGEGWYRKTFELDRETFGELGDGRVFLKVEGAFNHSKVWINGEFVGENHSGYMPKIYDVTSFFGANERVFRWPGTTYSITIHVNAFEKQGHWHEGAGVYRDVTLLITPSTCFALDTPYVSLEGVGNGEVDVNVKTRLENHHRKARGVVLKHRILSPRGDEVLSWRKKLDLPAHTSMDSDDRLKIANPELWGIENPALYTLRSTLETLGKDVVDEVETDFGLRTVEFADNGVFLLNGERVQIRGGCVHNDFAVFGVALPDEANARTVAELKAMGCNVIRSAHNHPSESLMRECDRQGMLLWSEYRGLLSIHEELRYDALRDLVRIVRRHPSVATICLANSGGDGNGELTERLKKAHDAVKSVEPSMTTSIAIEGTSDHNANGFAMVTDLVGYNGGVRPGADDWVAYGHENHPKRKIFISEFGSGRGARGIYRNVVLSPSEEKYFAGDGRVFEQTGGCFSMFDLCQRTEDEWRAIMERDFLYGGIVWSAIDYWGETAGWPTVISQFGAALDICRFRKDSFYFFQQEWSNEPMLHIFPAWHWPGRKGAEVPVWMYSNCDEVELFLDGESLGSKPMRRGTHLEWKTVYKPGTLKAVARTADGATIEKSSVTPRAPAEIALDASHPLRDGGYHFVTISIVDADENSLSHSSDTVSVRTEGDLRLIGICSGSPIGKETIGNDSCELFSGLALAIFQKPDSSNTAKAVFSIEGLPEKEWSVNQGGEAAIK